MYLVHWFTGFHIFIIYSLLDHQRIHSGEKPFQCDICLKSFNVKYNMIVHRRTHSSKKPYKCEICGKQYRSKSGRYAHIKSKHS